MTYLRLALLLLIISLSTSMISEHTGMRAALEPIPGLWTAAYDALWVFGGIAIGLAIKDL